VDGAQKRRFDAGEGIGGLTVTLTDATGQTVTYRRNRRSYSFEGVRRHLHHLRGRRRLGLAFVEPHRHSGELRPTSTSPSSPLSASTGRPSRYNGASPRGPPMPGEAPFADLIPACAGANQAADLLVQRHEPHVLDQTSPTSSNPGTVNGSPDGVGGDGRDTITGITLLDGQVGAGFDFTQLDFHE